MNYDHNTTVNCILYILLILILYDICILYTTEWASQVTRYIHQVTRWPPSYITGITGNEEE